MCAFVLKMRETEQEPNGYRFYSNQPKKKIPPIYAPPFYVALLLLTTRISFLFIYFFFFQQRSLQLIINLVVAKLIKKKFLFCRFENFLRGWNWVWLVLISWSIDGYNITNKQKTKKNITVYSTHIFFFCLNRYFKNSG